MDESATKDPVVAQTRLLFNRFCLTVALQNDTEHVSSIVCKELSVNRPSGISTSQLTPEAWQK